MFSVDKKGVEHTVCLALESWWLGHPESGIQETPLRYNIEMLENSELLVISVPNFYELIDRCRPFDLTIKAVYARAKTATQDRIHAAISMTAEERYDELADVHPEFLLRFPRNMIASYLGITPETLSRIRKNVPRK
jgi:CRP-like cAMP-binding protein